MCLGSPGGSRASKHPGTPQLVQEGLPSLASESVKANGMEVSPEASKNRLLRPGAHDVKEGTKKIKEEDCASRGFCLWEAAVFLSKEKLSKTTSGHS